MRANAAPLRITNQTAILDYLLERKVASRADLARATGMSKPTAGKIIDDLMHAGVVEEFQIIHGGRLSVGRPGKQVRLATARSRFVVIELGDVFTRMGALPPALPEQERWDVEFKTLRQGTRRGRSNLSLSTRCSSTSRDPGQSSSARRGSSTKVPGGVAACRPNLPLVGARRSATAPAPGLGLAPVALVQEAARARPGRAGGTRPGDGDFMLVDIADGVGGALMLGGRLYQGALPDECGEIGHTPGPGQQSAIREAAGGAGVWKRWPPEREGWSRKLGRVQRPRRALLCRRDQRPPNASHRPGCGATLDTRWPCPSRAALVAYGVRRVVLVGRVTELPVPATDYLVGAIQRGVAMWSRFDAVAVTLAPRPPRSRALGGRGIHQLRHADGLVGQNVTGAAGLIRGGPSDFRWRSTTMTWYVSKLSMITKSAASGNGAMDVLFRVALVTSSLVATFQCGSTNTGAYVGSSGSGGPSGSSSGTGGSMTGSSSSGGGLSTRRKR